MALRRKLLLVLGASLPFLALVLAAPGRAKAESAAKTAEDSQGVIEVAVVADEQGFEAVRSAIGERSFAPATLRFLRSERLDLRELIRENQGPSDVLIRCWVNVADRRHARLYFADRDAQRFLIRELALSGNLGELDREALSQALELSIRALLEDRRVGMTREEARSLLTKAETKAPETERTQPSEAAPTVGAHPQPGLSASAFWQFAKQSSELALSHGPGLLLGYERPLGAFQGSLWLSGQYRVSERFRDSRIGLTLDGAALRTGVELSRSFSRTAFWGVRLGGGLDVLHLSPTRGSGEAVPTLTAARTLSVPALSSALLVGSDVGARLRATLALVAEVPLTQLHYDVELEGSRTRAVDSWSVWPGLALALGLH
ncbi:MAG TPA: hypothetical protein VG937_03460 [Polyangiaceae bacterium]|nr:hypothetical protein [Polyangiaceae bacterium]